MFYLMCNDNDYSDLEIHFKRPDKNNFKINNVSEFVEYFIDYKKNREKRKEFIKKYFKELKDKLIKITMVNKYNIINVSILNVIVYHLILFMVILLTKSN